MFNYEDLFDALVSIKKLIWIQERERIGDEVEECVEDMDDKDITRVFGFDNVPVNTSEIVELVCDIHSGRFLAEIHTPCMKRRKGSKGRYFSWGHTHYKVFMADDLEELAKKAIAWAKEQKEIVVGEE